MTDPVSDQTAVPAAAPASGLDALATAVERVLGARVSRIPSALDELTVEVKPADLLDVARMLRDEDGLKFEICVDVCGIDYLTFGLEEWRTQQATASGFSRGVARLSADAAADVTAERRFAAVYHLLSVSLNQRIRLRCFCEDATQPMLDSVTPVWAAADWFEREAFDLYGILFRGHPDLRRILTDYGFIGHPFRKDFPLSGHVEVRYDPEKGRVIYQPVSIEPRTLVPRVMRHDNRYAGALKDRNPGA